MNKTLIFLNADSPVNRILRRAVVIGVLTIVSVLLSDWLQLANPVWVPIITAVLALIDKTLSEYRDYNRK
jgi:hypothetical protein